MNTRPILKRGAKGDNVELLQRSLNMFGAELVVDGDFGTRTQTAVARFQRDRELDVDGVVGPVTWTALGVQTDHVVDHVVAVEPARVAMPGEDKLEAAGRAAVDQALRIWERDIIDPRAKDLDEHAARSRAAIDRMIRYETGLGWSWQSPYRADGDYEWCGAFAASCWSVAGLVLEPHRRSFWSSTYRLDRWARYQNFEDVSSGKRPVAGGRMLVELKARSTAEEAVFSDGTRPRAGDVLLIGDGAPEYGDHICVVESFDADAGTFSTIEGNAVGLGPKGDRRQGVIKATRRIGGIGYCARRIIRPGVEDLA